MNKELRLHLRPVRGAKDLLHEDCQRQDYIEKTARNCAQCFGFKELQTPIFEYAPVFQNHLGTSSDIVNKETYTFEDRGGDAITLRPEGTAGIVRAVLSQGLLRKPPLKFYYHGPMFRYERPQKGRLRQFHQLGIEYFGNASVFADLEVLGLAWIFLKKLGVQEYGLLHINTLGSPLCRKSYVEELVKYLNLHKRNLSKDSQERLERNPLRILDSKSEEDQALLKDAPQMEDHLSKESLATFEKLKEGLETLDIPYKTDPYLVRGLDYYVHNVFEFKTKHLGSQDTLLAGGRYDGLVERMGGSPTPAVGWAAGIDRMSLLIEEMKKFPSLSVYQDVAILPMEESLELFGLRFAHQLRQKGLRVELILSGNRTKRLKKAQQLHCKWVWLMEKGKNTIQDRVSQSQWEGEFIGKLNLDFFKESMDKRDKETLNFIKEAEIKNEHSF